MIGSYAEYSGAYLIVLAIFMLLLFGLPMALWPLRWAGVLGWRLPGETDLAVYFGRCLGSVIVVLAMCTLAVARDPRLQPIWFTMLALNAAAMVLVHAYGAWRRIQPLSESLEIVFWFAQLVVTLAFWPGPPF